MARRHYTDEDRAAALAALQGNRGNIKRTARDLGVPESTLRRWSADPIRAAGGAELRARKREEVGEAWGRVRDKALTLAEALLDELAGCTEPRMLQTLVTVGAVATEKRELLSGGATERLDHVGTPPVREVVVHKSVE